MYPKRFSIRTLLVMVIPIGIVLALDVIVSYQFSRLKSELQESPTSTLAGSDPIGQYVATWQNIIEYNDVTTLYDRFCFCRRAKVWHEEQTLIEESKLGSYSRTSNIYVGLTGAEIHQVTPLSGGDLVVNILPNSVNIPKHATFAR